MKKLQGALPESARMIPWHVTRDASRLSGAFRRWPTPCIETISALSINCLSCFNHELVSRN